MTSHPTPRVRHAAGAIAVLVALTGPVAAHRVEASRFTAPIPPELLVAGAGATVAATAVASAVLVGGRGTIPSRSLPLPGRPGPVPRTAVRVVAVAAFCGLLLDGLLGPRTPAENLATLVAWPLWIDGLAMIAALVGSPWRPLSPWRAVYDGLCRLEGERIALAGTYPHRLGAWPAVAGFVLLVGVIENLTVVPRSPRLTAGVLAVYALAMLAGGLAYGHDWFRRADAVEVFLDLVGRVAPLRVDREPGGGYTVTLRVPGAGCLDPVRGVAGAVLAVMAVYTVSFDGFANTPEYRGLRLGVGDAIGLPAGLAGLVLYGLGAALFVAGFTAVARAIARAAGRTDRRGVLVSIAPTVIPIAVGYEFAHYATAVVEHSAAAVNVALGSTAPADPLAWLPLSAYWWFVVASIVLGHVVAVVVAHVATRRLAATARAAARAHLPLVALMVGYTMLSLWIVSRPFAA